jgi:Putative transposase
MPVALVLPPPSIYSTHVVFTLPAAIADIAYQNKAIIYDLLLKTSAETLTTIAADPKHLGARVGITSVLHSWGSAMTHHPHVHMIVPGGGISLDGERWVACRPDFFLPVRVLSRLFRRLFLERLLAAHQDNRLKFFGDHAALANTPAFAACLVPPRRAEWVVYAKRPFGGPQAVLAYLSRYTHRVAIANSRLIACDPQRRHLPMEGLSRRRS